MEFCIYGAAIYHAIGIHTLEKELLDVMLFSIIQKTNLYIFVFEYVLF